MKHKIEISIFLAIAIVAFAFCIGKPESEAVSEETSEVFAVSEETSEVVAQPFENPHESELIEAALDWHYVDDCLLTAYCPCEICCGEWAQNRPNGIVYTASGCEAQPDHTIAVDPSVIPLGAWVEIAGKIYHAEDVGGCVNGNHIDVYFNSHEEALNFNMRNETVRWYELII